MNERIEELEERCWEELSEEEGMYPVFNTKKFAELMLEDVLRIVGNGGEFCSRPKLIEQLKEHFGVEE